MKALIILFFSVISFQSMAQDGPAKKFNVNEDIKNRFEMLFSFNVDRNNPWSIHDTFDSHFKNSTGAQERGLISMYLDYLTDCEISSKVKKSGGKCLYNLKRYGNFDRIIVLINEFYKEGATREQLYPVFMCGATFVSSNNEIDLMACVSAAGKKEKLEFVAKQ
jgi:hypothetical protein